MKVYASRQLPTYQLIGDIVRVHWDGQQVEVGGVVESELQWCYEELVLPKTATTEEALANGFPSEIAAEFKPKNFVEEQNG